MSKKKVLVGLSGGVDSSVAASLLLEQGYEVVGVTMTFYVNDQVTKAQKENVQFAKEVCDTLGITHRVFDFTKDFRSKVIDFFVEGYQNGDTPNPCFLCNKGIKFGALMDYALQEGFDALATGHYAKIFYDEAKKRYCLASNPDTSKDQSYFLAGLSQNQLSRVIFPLAAYKKPQVKELARQRGLKTVLRKESQDICFVPDGEYATIIEAFSKKTMPEGDFLSLEGTVLGRHKGLQHYTIGQRRGLHISTGKPMYVYQKDASTNKILVSEKEALYCKTLTVKDLNFIATELIGALTQGDVELLVKTRYRTQAKKCLAHRLSPDFYTFDEVAATYTLKPEATLKVTLLERDFAVAPGQAAVFYGEGEVLAGGIISGTAGEF